MKQSIEEKTTVEGIVCDKCGQPIDYAELNNGAYTVGGIGIDWQKLGGIKVAAQDRYEFDFHKDCLADIIVQKAEPEVLKAAKPELFKNSIHAEKVEK